MRDQMSNSSSITEFLLLAFADTWELQLLHFWLFLGISLAVLLGNGLIITAIACDHHLHTPMYFFLLNLSLLDLVSISTTLPKAMDSCLWDNRHISYVGCAAQVFFFLFLISAELCLLTIMSYDRYVAICKPLHYGTLLGSRACVHMAAASWGTGCSILSCTQPTHFHYHSAKATPWTSSSVKSPRSSSSPAHTPTSGKFGLSCTGTFAYLKPPSISSPFMDMVVSFLYSVVPPAVNPLIYSMRNQEFKETLKKLIQSAVS
ncbi:unnamed protein product [Bubo scandiacus]